MDSKPTGTNEESLNRQLDALFAAYHEAYPAPEVTPDFMPRLWQTIEARRSGPYSFGRWTRAFVTAAAAICLLLGLLQTYAPAPPSFYSQTYIESLQSELTSEETTIVEALWTEDGGDSLQ